MLVKSYFGISPVTVMYQIFGNSVIMYQIIGILGIMYAEIRREAPDFFN
jgi:hypothetical protein